MELIEQIKEALQIAEREKRKMATFLSLVLIHADALRTMDPSEFCAQVGVPDSYRAEFQKMLATEKALAGMGYHIRQI